MTYIPTGQGFLYLAGVMDRCSRRIVSWSMATHLRVELVQAALAMATQARTAESGLIHHSDRDVQYWLWRVPPGHGVVRNDRKHEPHR